MAGHAWGYSSEHGPSEWEKIAPAAKGLHQSPVNIVTTDAEYDGQLTPVQRPLKIHYIPASCRKLINNGHSVQVCVDGKGSGYLYSWLEGGPYRHKYQLEQFHFHWGRSSQHGSEHLLDGKSYSGELHFVHWNIELFSTFAEAAKSANGLAVTGVFLEIGKENRYLKKLTDLLPKVSYSGDEIQVSGGIDPSFLLPSDRSKYFTYIGSLTTPPCFESVRFVIFNDPIEVSETQMNAFRQMNTYKKNQRPTGRDEYSGGKLLTNFRPPQPLNDRKIIKSFQ